MRIQRTHITVRSVCRRAVARGRERSEAQGAATGDCRRHQRTSPGAACFLGAVVARQLKTAFNDVTRFCWRISLSVLSVAVVAAAVASGDVITARDWNRDLHRLWKLLAERTTQPP